jgi:hypothetical protein
MLREGLIVSTYGVSGNPPIGPFKETIASIASASGCQSFHGGSRGVLDNPSPS